MVEAITAEEKTYYRRRFKYKKQLNILICITIAVLGLCSYLISVVEDMDWDFLSDFRFMTINGTLFTTVVSAVTVALSIYELAKGKDIDTKKLYYIRLSSVVTECIIAIVILMSLFPFVPDSPDILKFDSFNMHVIIPIMTIISFLITEPPNEKIKPIMRLNGASVITIYAIVIITLIIWGVIPSDKIPYSFLEVNTRPFWYILLAGVIVYSCAYFLSWAFIRWNKRVSDYWYQ